MATRQFTTTLKDYEGVEHDYSCATFPTSMGTGLLLDISEIVFGPIGRSLAFFFGASDELDIGKTLSEIPRMIIEKGGPDLVKRILAKTKRCRKDHEGKNVWEKLDNPHVFESVYAGNYLEMFKAVWWVIVEVNYGPFFAANFSDLKTRWKKLEDFIQTELIPEDTTMTDGSKPSENGSENAAETG